MVRKSLTLILFLSAIIFRGGYAQSLFSVDEIPENWRDESPAVILLKNQEVQVDKSGKIKYTRKEVITIFKGEVNELAVLAVNYSPMVKIKSISGAVYDSNGKSVRKIKKADIQDYSNFNSFSIFEDNRVKVVDLQQRNFPYTVEFEYELEFANLYYTPNWVPQEYSSIPVLKSTASYMYPEESNLRFYAKGLDMAPDHETVLAGNIQKSWMLENLDTFDPEPYIAPEESAFKVLFVAPSKFTFNGYNGDLSSWESMGKWFFELNKGKRNLSPAIKEKVKKLTQDLQSPEEKIRVLYHFLQQNTRYVSIQLGIGGLQPFDASTVEKYGYGDCKALSNYMAALLEEVGIESYYALIHGGKNNKPFFEEFPNDYFNHVILAIPHQEDYIWLECTSQTNPFGFLGSFTSDRNALLITESGGVLVRTPTYKGEINEHVQKATFHLDENGKASGVLEKQLKGLKTETNGLLYVVRSSAEIKKKWAVEHTSLPFIAVQRLEMNLIENIIPEIHISLDFDTKSLAAKTGNRLMFALNPLNSFSSSLSKVSGTRKSKISYRVGFSEIDEFEFLLPDGYQVESIPAEKTIESSFGTFKNQMAVSENKIVYKRSFLIKEGSYEADLYGDFVQFLSQVEKADNAKVVLVKNAN